MEAGTRGSSPGVVGSSPGVGASVRARTLSQVLTQGEIDESRAWSVFCKLQGQEALRHILLCNAQVVGCTASEQLLEGLHCTLQVGAAHGKQVILVVELFEQRLLHHFDLHGYEVSQLVALVLVHSALGFG